MDDSAFKAILDGLDANRIALDRWLEFWTWLVIIGVAFELVFVVWHHFDEICEWQKSRSRAVIFAPAKPSALKLVFEMFSVALVVIGVTGELRVERMLGGLETDIRVTNEKRVLLLQQQAGDAATSAHRAAADSARAKTDAGDAKSLASGARAEAGSFQREIASAKRQLAELGPRALLLDARKDEFSKAMEPVSPQKLLIVECIASRDDLEGNKEQIDLRQEMFDLLGRNAQLGGSGTLPISKFWYVGTGYLEFGCASGRFGAGTTILYSQKSPSGVKQAAARLAHEFSAAHIANQLWEADPAIGPDIDPKRDTGFQLAEKNPACIVLRIGLHVADQPEVAHTNAK
jgi:hypothetical protein